MNFPPFIFGLIFVALGAYLCYYCSKLRRTYTEPVDGTIVSYEAGFANVSGRKGSRSARAWFPVVIYTVNGVKYSHTCRNVSATSESESIENKIIPLLYNPEEPEECIEAVCNKASALWAGPIVILFGIVFIITAFIT